MAKSYVYNTGNGSQTNWSVPFPYIDTAHVHVYLNGVETTAFTWNNSSTIQFTSAPTNGALILIKRVTPTDTAITQFGSAAVLTGTSLNIGELQTLYAAQEAKDTTDGAVVVNDSTGAFDARSKKINNVADPSVATDAANKNYVDSSISTVLGSNAAQANAAALSAAGAATSASTAHTSETNSATSATNSHNSEVNSGNSATASAASASLAQLWATKMAGTVDGSGYSAAYYAAQAGTAAASAISAASTAQAYMTGFSVGTVDTGTPAASITGTPGNLKLNITIPTSSYTLPAATTGTLGGVKVSTGLAVDGSGNLTVSYGTTGTTAAAGNDSRITGALQASVATTTYAPLTGGGTSGTWGISITGSAGSVAWGNVSGRPTNVSSFTNDSGYITSSYTGFVKTDNGVANVGSLISANQSTGSAVASGATVAGSSMTYWSNGISGGSVGAGTWRNVSGISAPTGTSYSLLFQRIS